MLGAQRDEHVVLTGDLKASRKPGGGRDSGRCEKCSSGGE